MRTQPLLWAELSDLANAVETRHNTGVLVFGMIWVLNPGGYANKDGITTSRK